MPFADVIRFLMDKEQLPAEWDAAMWQDQEPDFQTKAFFSAKVENARFLDRAQTLIFDHLAGVQEQVTNHKGVNSEALSVFDRAHFVKRMRDFMIAEGMAKADEFKDVDQSDVTDTRSMARLNLIFDTNVRQAYGYGQWKQGMTPAALKAFPAARLVRVRGVKEPRPRHAAHLGEVRLKTDFAWWAGYINAKKIGGFEVPWGPYGFGSGVTQRDVSRREAENLGLKVDTGRGEMSTNKDLKITDGLQAGTKTMDTAIKKKLLEELRAGRKPRDPKEAAREAAAKARREALNRGLADAEARGDAAKAEKFRKAIAELAPASGLDVREEPDKIWLVASQNGDKIMPDDAERAADAKNSVLPQPGQDRDFESATHDFRKVLSPNGNVYGREDHLYRSEQFQRIESEAERLGYLYKELLPVVVGGREHDLTFDEVTGTVLKFTKPLKAAYVVRVLDGRPKLFDGYPIEYLERMALHEEIFGIKSSFVGIGGEENNRRIITRQDLVEGKPAWWEDITKMMVNDLGFTKMQGNLGIGYADSYAYIRDDVAVFDMRPANVFQTADGLLIAVDSIPVRLTDSNRAAFR